MRVKPRCRTSDVRLYADMNNDGRSMSATCSSTVTTDATGNYLFTGLTAGDYRARCNYLVDVTSTYRGLPGEPRAVPGGSPITTPPPNGMHDVTLDAGQQSTVYLTADFGYNWAGSIGNYVWWDDNANGLQDENATQGHRQCRRDLLYFDANGNGILDPANGDYQVGFKPYQRQRRLPVRQSAARDLTWWMSTRTASPPTACATSCPPPITWCTRTWPPARAIRTADFGYFQGAKVEGNVFWDADRNGLFDSSEPGENGLTQVTVTLTGTDMFGNPINGDHHHRRRPGISPSWCPRATTPSPTTPRRRRRWAIRTPPRPPAITFHAYPGEDWQAVFDFGVDNTGKIGDRVWNDANGDGNQTTGESRDWRA